MAISSFNKNILIMVNIMFPFFFHRVIFKDIHHGKLHCCGFIAFCSTVISHPTAIVIHSIVAIIHAIGIVA